MVRREAWIKIKFRVNVGLVVEIPAEYFSSIAIFPVTFTSVCGGVCVGGGRGVGRSVWCMPYVRMCVYVCASFVGIILDVLDSGINGGWRRKRKTKPRRGKEGEDSYCGRGLSWWDHLLGSISSRQDPVYQSHHTQLCLPYKEQDALQIRG